MVCMKFIITMKYIRLHSCNGEPILWPCRRELPFILSSSAWRDDHVAPSGSCDLDARNGRDRARPASPLCNGGRRRTYDLAPARIPADLVVMASRNSCRRGSWTPGGSP